MMIRTPESFEFEAGGRNYRCHLEQPTGVRADAWWWFGVVGDRGRHVLEASPIREGVGCHVDDTHHERTLEHSGSLRCRSRTTCGPPSASWWRPVTTATSSRLCGIEVQR